MKLFNFILILLIATQESKHDRILHELQGIEVGFVAQTGFQKVTLR